MRILFKYTIGLIFLVVGIIISVIATLIEAVYKFIVKDTIILFE